MDSGSDPVNIKVSVCLCSSEEEHLPLKQGAEISKFSGDTQQLNNHAGVSKWTKDADCKSEANWLRGFESLYRHRISLFIKVRVY